MRTVKFIVDSRGLHKDPTGNFSGFRVNDKTPIRAEFTFSEEWDRATIRVAGFWNNGVECAPQVLAGGTTCTIPADAISNQTFEMQIFGKKDTATMKTNKLKVRLNGGAL